MGRHTGHRSAALTLVPTEGPPLPPFAPLDDAGDLFVVLLDSAPDAAVVADAGGRMVLVNSQTERLFGYRREELEGQPVEVLVPVRFRSGHVDHRQGFLGGTGAPMNGPSGRSPRCAGTARSPGRSLPQRHRDALGHPGHGLSPRRHRPPGERGPGPPQRGPLPGPPRSAPDAAVIADADGVTVLVNGQTERLFGTPGTSWSASSWRSCSPGICAEPTSATGSATCGSRRRASWAPGWSCPAAARTSPSSPSTSPSAASRRPRACCP
jgi:hypothetical protein